MKRSQVTIEYLVLIAGLILAIMAVLAKGGFLFKRTEALYDTAGEGIGNMKDHLVELES